MIVNKIYCFIFFFFISVAIENEYHFNFIVWNIGQGAWSSYLTPDSCLHFDMGGEKFDFSKVKKLCKNKNNHIYLTHLDWDHINFIKPFLNLNLKSCLFYPKREIKPWLNSIRKCQKKDSHVQVISWGTDNKDKNSSSIIYLVSKKILITGDAPISEEKKWYFKVPRNIRLLILGHHGSKTSTSDQLLTWAQPKMTIASARQSKYGHPHAKVTDKLKKLNISILRTEELGDIHFQIK